MDNGSSNKITSTHIVKCVTLTQCRMKGSADSRCGMQALYILGTDLTKKKTLLHKICPTSTSDYVTIGSFIRQPT